MKKNKFYEVVFTILLSLSYFIYSSAIKISYYYAIVLGILFFVFFLLAFKQNDSVLKKDKKFTNSIIYLLIPLFIVPWSFILVILFDNSLLFEKFLSRCLLYFITPIEAIALYGLFKDKAINIFFRGAILNYIFVILLFILQNGIFQVFTTVYYSLFSSDSVKSILEAHEVTFVFGILLVYYLLNNFKNNKGKCLICFIFSLMGYKRIMLLAILFSLLYGLLSLTKLSSGKLSDKKLLFSSKIIFCIIILFFVLWLLVIKNDVLLFLSLKYDINFMGRLNIYSLISNDYIVSPFYLGKGLGYISYWGEVNSSLTNYTALHSGIIQMYVENGFVLFCLYLYNMIYLNSKRILKINRRSVFVYLSICVYTLICWFTDNIATYYNYLVAFSLISITLLNDNDKDF